MTTPLPDTRRSFLLRTLGAGLAGALAGTSGATAAEPKPTAWRIGCFTRPWDDQDWRTALDAIAEAGFTEAGLMTTKSESRLVISPATSIEEAGRVGEEAAKRGLAIPSVYGGGIPVGASLEAGIAALRTLIDNGAACGARTVMMGGVGDARLHDRYYTAIAECCPYAAEKRIEITLKPHGGLNATGLQCRASIEGVGHRAFRLWYDPGNIFYYSDGVLNPVVDAATVDGIVTGMCIKDYRHPKDVLLTPGTGRVDFAAVLKRLSAGGFRSGPLVVETLRRGTLAETLVEAKRARRFVEWLAA